MDATTDHQAAVREFLRSRRARVSPDQTGPITGGRRLVRGLRREEVAMLAAVSTDYHAKIHVSDPEYQHAHQALRA